MRHPVNTGLRRRVRGSVAVGGVHGFVVEHALGQAVPEDLDPPVGQGAQRGVVAFLVLSHFA